jgi:hypothetical protein
MWEPPTGFLVKIFVHKIYSSTYFCYMTFVLINKCIKYIVHESGISMRMISCFGFGLHLTRPVTETDRCFHEIFKLFVVCLEYKFILKTEAYKRRLRNTCRTSSIVKYSSSSTLLLKIIIMNINFTWRASVACDVTIREPSAPPTNNTQRDKQHFVVVTRQALCNGAI